MEPEIRYCTTSDEVSIAFASLGEGDPLLITPPLGFGHIQLEMGFPPLRAWYERLAMSRLVIRYDDRASGLSQRRLSASQFPPDHNQRDIDAVVTYLGLQRFDLMGCGVAGFAACAYAAAFPRCVRRLVLWAVPGNDDAWGSEQVRAAVSLADKDYVSFTEALAGSILGWADPERAHDWARFMRAAMSEADHQTFFDATSGRPAPPVRLAAIKAPTLVLHPARFRNMPLRSAQALAAAITQAKLVVCSDDESGLPIGEQATSAIEKFLGGGSPASASVSPRRRDEPVAFRTILFTDMVDHTLMMRRLGDQAGRSVLREHERITRDVLKRHGGTEVKTDGDSFMATFMSAAQAVQCAVALQRAFAAHNTTPSEPILIRAGLNIGEPIEEKGDYFGSAIILGARIKDQAGAGEILVPEAVRHLLSGKSFVYADRGEVLLKGFEDPVRLYEVRWQD